jgi:hypothetical protein
MYLEMQGWRRQFLNSRWLMLNEEVACKKLVNCSMVTELRNVRKFVYKASCKWEKETRKIPVGGDGRSVVLLY